MIKCIIFDVYGTLISTGTGSVDAVRKILDDKKINISPEEFYKAWKNIHRKNISEIIEFKNEAAVFECDLKELYKIFNITGNYKKDVLIMLETLGKRKAFEETNRVLDILSESFTLCIGSTTDNEPLFSDLHNNNINIDNVFTSESLELYKPQKDFYKQIIQKMGFESKEVLFVGDSLIDDVYGPKQLDITTCWLNRKQLDIEASQVHPDYIINNLNDLLFLPLFI